MYKFRNLMYLDKFVGFDTGAVMLEGQGDHLYMPSTGQSRVIKLSGLTSHDLRNKLAIVMVDCVIMRVGYYGYFVLDSSLWQGSILLRRNEALL